jgi:putative molybdopterin biosynthesis protein
MQSIEVLRNPDRIKPLGDARRREILRLLMAAPATLTQLSRRMHHSPAWVRHHLKVLEVARLVELIEVRKTGRITEKFYQAMAGAYVVQEMIAPRTRQPTLIFSGSDDLAMGYIGQRFASRLILMKLPVGSLDGLINLRLGLCQVAGAHLLDESGEYNTPYVRRLFPDEDVELVTLAYRTQGLMFAAGNPKHIRQVADLGRPGIRFVNRNRGSGTRLLLDKELKRAHVPPDLIHGYGHEVKTHTEAASLIEAGQADAALGLHAAAHQHGLDFITLFEERYDLVFARDEENALAPLLDYMQTADFRRSLEALTGYNTAHSGERIPVLKEKEA